MVDVLSIINRVNVYHFHGDVPVLQTEGEEAYLSSIRRYYPRNVT